MFHIFSNSTIEEITGIHGINMEWARYEARIVDRYKVALLGWPQNIPFSCEVSASALDVVLNAIMDGTCKWKKLTKREYQEHVHKRSGNTDTTQNTVDEGVGNSDDELSSAEQSESPGVYNDDAVTSSSNLILPIPPRPTYNEYTVQPMLSMERYNNNVTNFNVANTVISDPVNIYAANVSHLDFSNGAVEMGGNGFCMNPSFPF